MSRIPSRPKLRTPEHWVIISPNTASNTGTAKRIPETSNKVKKLQVKRRSSKAWPSTPSR
ncbi:MAG TPA: hypothetical protein IGR15_08915 [Synechococcus sp. M44_DOE_062]|nr:hypothetical protein [Synechococcus sp. M44_DOE_062]